LLLQTLAEYRPDDIEGYRHLFSKTELAKFALDKNTSKAEKLDIEYAYMFLH
jgi:hypothetical protein